MRRYGYAWLTVGFFLVSIALHWLFGWYSFAEEARAHGETPELTPYLYQMGRDTFENWQSEFLQLLWQVVGLAYFLYVAPQRRRRMTTGWRRRSTRSCASMAATVPNS